MSETRMRCSVCPIKAAGLDLPCPCERHERFATLMESDPETWGPLIVAAARRRAGLDVERVAPADRPVGPDGVIDAAVSHAADSRAVQAVAYTDLRPLVWECDYRGEVLGEACGCAAEVRHCGLGRGFFATAPHEVRMSDCLRCVAGKGEPGR